MRKVYHPNRVVNTGIVLLVVPFLLLLIIVPLILTVNAIRRQEVVDRSGCIPLVILAGALAIALWQGAHYSEKTTLILSEHEVEYRTPSLVLRTSWDNIEAIRGGPAFPVLQLKTPVDIGIPVLLRRDLTSDHQIPLYRFDYAPQSALAQDLKHFAPHLFHSPACT